MIPQCSPKSNYFAYKQEIDAAITHVLNSGQYILAEEVSNFESDFSQYLGVSNAIGVANGTDAIVLALRACNIGEGDKVITVSHTAVATIAAITQTGACPIFIDIDPQTYTIDINDLNILFLENKDIQPKAIIPVHLYGQPVDMDSIISFAKRHGMVVIEDCAQAHGAYINDKKVGSIGDIGCFSFYPTKNLGAIGDGGMLVTNHDDIAEKIKLMREYGWKDRNNSEVISTTSRLDEIQAAILRVKLKYLDVDNDKRRKIANIYTSTLNHSVIKLPKEMDNTYCVYHQYVISVKNRDELRAVLHENNIDTAIHYPIPVHLQKAYINTGLRPLNLTSTEEQSSKILSLPMFPEMKESDATTIADIINKNC